MSELLHQIQVLFVDISLAKLLQATFSNILVARFSYLVNSWT